jgi:hypothetical protein
MSLFLAHGRRLRRCSGTVCCRGSSGLALHGDGTPAIDPALTSTKLGDATIANLLMRFGTRLMQLGLSAAQLDRSIARLSIGLMAKAKGADLNDLAI